MSGSVPIPGSPGRAARRRVLAIALPALIVALAALCVTSVPAGYHGLRRLHGASAWSVLDPGLALRVPLLQEYRLVPDEATARGGGPGEGPEPRSAWAVSARLPGEVVRQGAARGMTPAEFLAANVDQILAAGKAGEDLRSELSRRGFEDLIVSAPGVSASASASPRRTLRHPVVIIGLDGADWQIAEPLMAQGRLPVIARLRKEGEWGHLRSSNPMLSPLLWTTAATGKGPEEHGIVDFLVPDPATGKKVPITSKFRKVKALWNIFGDRGLFSTFIGWWATFPAESVHGEIVSDRVAYSLFDVGRPQSSAAGLVYPPSLWNEVRPRIVRAADLADDQILGLARVNAAEIRSARDRLAAGGEGASKDRLVHLMKIVASTMTYQRIALDRIAAGQPDLLGIYYEGIDEVSHRFAHCTPPALPLCPPGDAKRFGGTIAAFYEIQDRLVGEILDAIDPSSYVILMSDHGFRSGGDRPRDFPPDIDGKPALWHRPYGIALVHGPGIPHGRFDSVTLLDITPTVLRLAGLPLAGDMPGHPLVEPGASGNAAEPPPAVATYEGTGGRLQTASAEGPAAAAGQDAMLENLRSLGYIGSEDAPSAPSPPAAGPAGGTPGTVTAHTNVGALHLQKGEIAQAEKEFLAALAIVPRYLPALMGMSQVRTAQGRLDEAMDFARRAMRENSDPDPSVYLRFATLATQTGRGAEAVKILTNMGRRRPSVAEIPVGLAILADKAGDGARSESLLLSALEIDPASTEAMSRLFQKRREAGREATLEPAVREALKRNPTSVLHLNWLGLILERRGDTKGAEKEFEAALKTAPDFGGTMANLGSLYGREGRLEEAVTILDRALRIDPDNLECRVNLGAALGKLGRTSEALRVLEKGRKASPDSPEVLNALAVAYAQSGDTGKAEDLFRRSLEIRSDQPRVRQMLQEIQKGG